MPKNTKNPKKPTNRGRSSSPVTNRPVPLPAKRVQLDTSEEQQQQQQQVPEQSTSTLNKTDETTDMEVEVTSTLSPLDKGKGPEQVIPPVNKEPIDLDQSFDASENMLNQDNKKPSLHFERENGAPIFFTF